jgi:hypothetical protein
MGDELEVFVNIDDFNRAHEQAIHDGIEAEYVQVRAEIDVGDALELATVDQLRDALAREEGPGYTQDQLSAIHDCFAALLGGDCQTASALLPRIFEHRAQIAAAETGLQHSRKVAA